MAKYPKISVALTKIDGNALNIIGCTMGAMRKGGIDNKKIEAYRKEAMSGDYDNLLRVTMEWVSTS